MGHYWKLLPQDKRYFFLIKDYQCAVCKAYKITDTKYNFLGFKSNKAAPIIRKCN